MPTAERDPKKQDQFARLIERDSATLWRWKQLPGWNDAVYALAHEHLTGELAPIMHAQVKEAKRGSLSHAQWLFEVSGKWTPKQKHEMTTRLEITEIETVLPPDDPA